jgi:hypothetical protein
MSRHHSPDYLRVVTCTLPRAGEKREKKTKKKIRWGRIKKKKRKKSGTDPATSRRRSLLPRR